MTALADFDPDSIRFAGNPTGYETVVLPSLEGDILADGWRRAQSIGELALRHAQGFKTTAAQHLSQARQRSIESVKRGLAELNDRMQAFAYTPLIGAMAVLAVTRDISRLIRGDARAKQSSALARWEEDYRDSYLSAPALPPRTSLPPTLSQYVAPDRSAVSGGAWHDPLQPSFTTHDYHKYRLPHVLASGQPIAPQSSLRRSHISVFPRRPEAHDISDIRPLPPFSTPRGTEDSVSPLEPGTWHNPFADMPGWLAKGLIGLKAVRPDDLLPEPPGIPSVQIAHVVDDRGFRSVIYGSSESITSTLQQWRENDPNLHIAVGTSQPLPGRAG